MASGVLGEIGIVRSRLRYVCTTLPTPPVVPVALPNRRNLLHFTAGAAVFLDRVQRGGGGGKVKSVDTYTKRGESPTAAVAFRNKSLLLGESERNARSSVCVCVWRVKGPPPAILENVTRMFSNFPFDTATYYRPFQPHTHVLLAALYIAFVVFVSLAATASGIYIQI